MPLEKDAAGLIEILSAMMPPPGPGTDAAAYRALTARMIAPGSDIPLAHVETRTIDGPGGDLPIRYYADGAGPLPTILFLHGGGWVTCNLETHDTLCRRLAKASGMAILSVDYRLSPEARYPAALEDATAALDWAAGPDGAAMGIDATRLAVAGDSAGGNLAAALCLLERERGRSRIKHQLLIYPATDTDFTTASYIENGSGYFLTAGAMRWYWEQYLGTPETRDPIAAPLRADPRGLPAATILTAGYDPLRDEGLAYADRLREAGVPVEYRCFDGAIHGFMGIETFESSRDGLAFIADALRRAFPQP